MDLYTLKIFLNSTKDKVDNIDSFVCKEKLENDLKEEQSKTEKDGFYNNRKESEKVFKTINSIKAILDLESKVKETYNELSVIAEFEDEILLEQADKLITEFESIYDELETLVLLSDSSDKCDAIMEIHSGAGGTESNDWVDMLYRMYQMYFGDHNFKAEVLDITLGDEVGIKSITLKVNGNYAYGLLKSESGVHRLIRISPFDSSHQRHTTFASVQVTPFHEDDIEITIDPKDIRVDVFHSSGAGGQGVNTTDSAVRITHIPSKIVVTCQNERSQIQNKETALSILKSKLYQIEIDKRKEEQDRLKGRVMISFGSQIRTYTFQPYTLVKDHRTEAETPQIDKVMNGDIDLFIKEYLKAYKND